jgi:hypothetical protein
MIATIIMNMQQGVLGSLPMHMQMEETAGTPPQLLSTQVRTNPVMKNLTTIMTTMTIISTVM